MCQAMRTTVYRYFTSLFVCLFFSIKPSKSMFVYLLIKNHMINPSVISGVIIIILKYRISRIVDLKVENEFIDTSS